MNKVIFAAALCAAVAIPAESTAQDGQSIMFEIGIGFGNASGGRTDGNNKAKFCKNRNTDRLMMGAVRFRYDNAEAHVARWFHDEDTRCNRDSWAAGLGYVIDTQNNGGRGNNDVYASWTPGVAYTWGDDKGFTGQDETDTNWRNTGHFQTFNRVAVGAGGDDGAVELAVHRYGTFNPEHGENFVTVGGVLRNLDRNNNNGGPDRGLTPPTTINNTTINITDGTESGSNGGEGTTPVGGLTSQETPL